MTKILYMTDHSQMTGFGYVADKVCDGLGQKYGKGQVFLLGWGFRATEAINRGSYLMLPTGDHPFGADALPQMLKVIEPECLITQNDSRMLIDWMPNLRPLPCTWINYPVIDGRIWQKDGNKMRWPSNWTEFMKMADYTVAMSEFGGKILDANGVKNTVIPHGVETDLFKPLPPEAREKLKADKFKDKFVVLGVFKNMERKMPDKWLQIFTLFKEDKKDVVGILHTNPAPPIGHFNLPQHCVDYGLKLGEDIFFSPVGIPRQNMPLLYGTADVLLHSGFGESFGIPVLEAMACGLPIVGTNATTAPELIGDCGLLIDPVRYKNGLEITMGSYNGVEFVLPDIYDGAKKLDKLYNDPKLREELGFKATQKAAAKYDWSLIIPKWDEIIKKATGITDLPDEWQKLLAVAGKEEKKPE